MTRFTARIVEFRLREAAQDCGWVQFHKKINITCAPTGVIQFLTRCRGQEIRVWPTSSVPCHSGWLLPLLQRGYRPRRFSCKRTNISGVFLWVLFAYLSLFIAQYRCIMKASGCCVALPVSRREPRRRCGGRRGGLNDSQHCAVGPGLQSPQRWSFPPASISLAVSLHSTRSSSSPSNHFALPRHPYFFSPFFPNPTAGDYF